MVSGTLARAILVSVILQQFAVGLTFAANKAKAAPAEIANKQQPKKAAKEVERIDTMAEFPSYDMVYRMEKLVIELIGDSWKIVKKEVPADVNNTETDKLIEDVIWPKLMVKFFEAQKIRQMDLDIRFRRNPANFLDVLLGFSNFGEMKNMSMDPTVDKFGFVKLRWTELSSMCSQFLRFYNWRYRDIFHGGVEMLDIINALNTKKAYIWTPKTRTPGDFNLVKVKTLPDLLTKNLFLDDGNENVFLGLRRLMDTNPDVLTKMKFDETACTKGHDHLHIEPAGIDVPYYLLFFMCQVDLKNYVLTSIVNIYLTIFLGEKFMNQAELRTQLHDRLSQKIDMFDKAFGEKVKSNGPAYLTQPGFTLCNPENPEWGTAYEKFTNFVKVFIAPEVDLHKSGTCRPTCDILDVTYRPCDHNDTDCRMDREKECVQQIGRCNKFNPPCPFGHYHCHNSTEKVSFCPSSRPDRLYEFAIGQDEDTKLHYGRTNQQCSNETVEVQGGWKLEDDTLVVTPHFCEICTCFCFEPITRYLGNFSVRNFVTRIVSSDFKNNRVIVGIKFHRIKDQIHMMIADAVALPGKNVDHSSIRWLTPKYENDPKFIIRLNMDLRSLNIDDVVTDAIDRVLTGVRFYQSDYRGKFLYEYVGLETLTHKINREDGTLIQGTGRFRRNANSTVSRTLYNYNFPPNGPDDPAYTNCPALPDTLTNDYVVFRATSLDKDVAQSTIPYFDIQKLIAPNPRWLKGVGIIQKTCPGFGGFLAFKLIEHLVG